MDSPRKERNIIRIIGCGVIVLFGISTWVYPIPYRFGMVIIAAGISLYVITESP